MTPQPKGLGRGLDSLIPQNFDASILVSEDERIQKLAIDKLIPRSGQPRQHFDDQSLHELADSIKTHGILLPLVVIPHKNGTFQIVAGERRWRAAKLAKLSTLPVIIRSLKELEQLEIALIENVQRVDLSPLEQAVSIERLHQQFSLTYESISARLGKAQSTIANIVRLLQLPAKAREALEKGEISEGHARTILALKNNPDRQAVLLANIIKFGWSVRQTERYVTSVKAGIRNEDIVHERVKTETPLTKLLSKRFKTSVYIRRTAHGGRLEIAFKTDKELERISKLLS